MDLSIFIVMIENKSINDQSYVLGQYMTPLQLTQTLIGDIQYDENSIYVEPSFGTGNFVKTLINSGIPATSIVGCELDEKLYESCDDLDFKKENINFYDWKFKTDKKII